MGKLIYALTLFTVLSFTSCSKDDLKIEEKTVEVNMSGKVMSDDIGFSYVVNPDGKTVQFTNESTDAKNFAWFFGDGESTKEESPKHVYSKSGKYTVTFSVRRKSTEEPAFVVGEINLGE